MSDQIDTCVTKEPEAPKKEGLDLNQLPPALLMKLLSIDLKAVLAHLNISSNYDLMQAIGNVRLAKEHDAQDKFEMAIFYARRACKNASKFYEQNKEG